MPGDWLNYHHLLYFWTVARLGSVTKASEELRIAQPTISGQIRQLEETWGRKLFSRAGRSLALTDFGKDVFQYADEIFHLGQELVQVAKGGEASAGARITIGIADLLPKLVVARILAPLFDQHPQPRISCLEDRPDRLLAELSRQSVDLVLTDSPIPPWIRIRAYNHLLGASAVSLYTREEDADHYRRNFPACLKEAQWLLPLQGSPMRRLVEEWARRHGIHIRMRGEFQDSALLKVCAQAYGGVLAAATVVEDTLLETYGLVPIGGMEGVSESFYAISVERRVTIPAVMQIIHSGRELFARTRRARREA